MYLGGVICLLNIRYDKNSVVCIFEGYCFYIEMFVRYLFERYVCIWVCYRESLWIFFFLGFWFLGF